MVQITQCLSNRYQTLCSVIIITMIIIIIPMLIIIIMIIEEKEEEEFVLNTDEGSVCICVGLGISKGSSSR